MPPCLTKIACCDEQPDDRLGWELPKTCRQGSISFYYVLVTKTNLLGEDPRRLKEGFFITGRPSFVRGVEL